MKIVSKNKKATFNNEIIERYVAGIILTGAETKTIKNGQGKIDGAYVFVNPHNAILRNAHIPLWTHANESTKSGYIPDRDRLLLLTKKQLQEITIKRKELKAHIVPVVLGIEKNLVKVEIAIARPLKKYDKKNRKKEREEKLKVQRLMKTVEVR
ncbi:SsrA-binding protein [bacterium]|nr:SsrA-binding protein [bacterium]